MRLQHTPNLCERLPWILEVPERLPKKGDVEHAVVEDEVMRVHDRVLDAALAWRLRACVGDHVGGEIDCHVVEVGAADSQCPAHQTGSAADVDHSLVCLDVREGGKSLGGPNVCAPG